jgi:hypothetical protein
VRGKDGTEYTIAEGWHTVVGALTLDGKDLRDVAVTLTATSDDGTRVYVPRKIDFTELAEGVGFHAQSWRAWPFLATVIAEC